MFTVTYFTTLYLHHTVYFFMIKYTKFRDKHDKVEAAQLSIIYSLPMPLFCSAYLAVTVFTILPCKLQIQPTFELFILVISSYFLQFRHHLYLQKVTPSLPSLTYPTFLCPPLAAYMAFSTTFTTLYRGN